MVYINNSFDYAGSFIGILILGACVFILIAWIHLAVIASESAKRKGYSEIFWGVVAFFALSPPLAILIIHCLPLNEQKLIESGSYEYCPECLSLIKANSKKCAHCGHKLTSESLSPRLSYR